MRGPGPGAEQHQVQEADPRPGGPQRGRHGEPGGRHGEGSEGLSWNRTFS